MLTDGCTGKHNTQREPQRASTALAELVRDVCDEFANYVREDKGLAEKVRHICGVREAWRERRGKPNAAEMETLKEDARNARRDDGVEADPGPGLAARKGKARAAFPKKMWWLFVPGAEKNLDRNAWNPASAQSYATGRTIREVRKDVNEALDENPYKAYIEYVCESEKRLEESTLMNGAYIDRIAGIAIKDFPGESGSESFGNYTIYRDVAKRLAEKAMSTRAAADLRALLSHMIIGCICGPGDHAPREEGRDIRSDEFLTNTRAQCDLPVSPADENHAHAYLTEVHFKGSWRLYEKAEIVPRYELSAAETFFGRYHDATDRGAKPIVCIGRYGRIKATRSGSSNPPVSKKHFSIRRIGGGKSWELKCFGQNSVAVIPKSARAQDIIRVGESKNATPCHDLKDGDVIFIHQDWAGYLFERQ